MYILYNTRILSRHQKWSRICIHRNFHLRPLHIQHKTGQYHPRTPTPNDTSTDIWYEHAEYVVEKNMETCTQNQYYNNPYPDFGQLIHALVAYEAAVNWPVIAISKTLGHCHEAIPSFCCNIGAT